MPRASSERLPRLGRYQVLSKLAEGGMAEIFLAKALGAMGFERLVAIKLIRPHLTEDPDFVKMFLDEARIAMHLHHRNIVQTSDLERADNTYFIAMEFIHGVNVYDLYERVAQRGEWIELPLALYIISEACKGLHFAHTRTQPDGRPLSIIHRDISPQNILLSFEGEVKIMDFGIAKASERLHQTMPGIVKGKYAYMAPEILQDKPVDHRVDIFAAGVVLYELLTRENPFAGANAVETIEAVLAKQVIPPTQKAGAGSRALDAIVMKALAKDPNQRFQTARELSAALTDHGLGLTGARWDIAAGDSSVSQLLQNIFPEKAAQTFTQSSAEDVVIPHSKGEGHASHLRMSEPVGQGRLDSDHGAYAAQETLLQVSAVDGHEEEIYDDEARTALALDVNAVESEVVEATTSTTLPPEPATDRALDAVIDSSEVGVTTLDQGFLSEQLAMDSIGVDPSNRVHDRGPTQAPRKPKNPAPGFVSGGEPIDNTLSEPGVTAKDLDPPKQAHVPYSAPNQPSTSFTGRAGETRKVSIAPDHHHSGHLRTASYSSGDASIPSPKNDAAVTPTSVTDAEKKNRMVTISAYAAVIIMLAVIVLTVILMRGDNSTIVDIPVHSQPTGATVIINGIIQENKTPLSASVPSGHRHSFEISAPGYKTFRKTVKPEPNSRIQINAILSAQ